MFGFFSSKKKKDEARRMEKADSFYEEEQSDDINNDYDQKGMNDDEYRRRVTEEIAKRKSIARGGKVKPPTPTATSTTAHRPMSVNPKAAPTPASTKTASVTPPPQSGQVPSGMKAAPSASGTVVPLGRPPAAASSRPPASAPAVAAGAVSSSKSAPPSTTSANAHRQNSSTTSAPVTPASTTSKTSSSAAKPFVPDPKAIQQLVGLGFSYPVSAYALKIKNNKANMAADFLLQKSEAEIKALLAADAAQSPSATKPASTTPSSTSATALHTATTTGTSSPKSSSPTPGATPADSGAAKINPVDAAMAAILAKREALKKKQAAEKLQRTVSKKLLSSKSKTLTPTETAATSEPVNAAVYDRLSNYKTKGVSACEAQEEEDKQRGDAQERRRKALSRTPSTRSPERVTSAESSVLGTPPRGGVSPLKRAGSQPGDSLYNKKTESMLLKEKQDEEDRAKKEAHDRKWKKMTSPVGAGGHTSESEPEVFDKLYSKKLESHEIAEKVKDEEKARLEKLEAHISGRAGAALPAPDASALLRKTKSAATREQLTAEEKQRFEEEERRERERHPTPRESSSRRGSFSSRCSASLERGHSQSLGERRESIGEAAMRHSSGRGGGGRARGSSLDDVQATQVDDDDDDVTKEDDDDGSITDVDEAGFSSVPVSALTTPPGSALNSARQTGASAGDRRSSFREMRSTSISSMGSSHVDHAAASSATIPGLIPRSVMNFSVKETQDHRWEGKVCTLTKEGKNMLTVKGCYGDKTECIAVTSAYAHPVYAVPQKKSFCRICEEAFNKYLKAENCQNCGQLVCGDCSAESWPQAMVPESFNDKKTDFVRVCAACNTAMERFANTLKSGDFAAVITHYNEGNVNLHHPFLTLPDSPYAIHCAAASGNVKVLEWLVEEKFCSWKDAATGKPLVNASGLTVLAIAARRGDREMMRYAAQQMHCSVADITDIAVLQRGLHAALEAPGALPSLTLKKTASPMATSASFRRYEKMSAPTEEPQIPTDSLFQQAAELAQRLKSTPSMQRMPSKGSSIVSPSQLHPPSGGATSQEAHASTKSAVPLPSTVSEASPSKPPMASSPQRAKSWKQPIVPALPGMETSPPPSPVKVVVPAAAVAAAVVTATVAAAGAVVETGGEREEAAAAAGAVGVPDDLTVKTESEPDQEAEGEHNKEDVAQSNEPATPTVLSVADVISTDAAAAAAADEATEKTESTTQQEKVATPTVPALADVLKMEAVKDAEKKEPQRQQQEPETEAPDAEDTSLWVAVADTLGALQLSTGNSAPADVDKANDDQDVSKQEGKEVEEVTPAPEISPAPTSTTTAAAAASAAVDANTSNDTVATDTTAAAVEVAGTAATEEPTPKKSKSKKSKKSKSKSTP